MKELAKCSYYTVFFRGIQGKGPPQKRAKRWKKEFLYSMLWNFLNIMGKSWEMSENVQKWDKFCQKFVHYFAKVCYNKVT